MTWPSELQRPSAVVSQLGSRKIGFQNHIGPTASGVSLELPTLHRSQPRWEPDEEVEQQGPSPRISSSCARTSLLWRSFRHRAGCLLPPRHPPSHHPAIPRHPQKRGGTTSRIPRPRTTGNPINVTFRTPLPTHLRHNPPDRSRSVSQHPTTGMHPQVEVGGGDSGSTCAHLTCRAAHQSPPAVAAAGLEGLSGVPESGERRRLRRYQRRGSACCDWAARGCWRRCHTPSAVLTCIRGVMLLRAGRGWG